MIEASSITLAASCAWLRCYHDAKISKVVAAVAELETIELAIALVRLASAEAFAALARSEVGTLLLVVRAAIYASYWSCWTGCGCAR